MRRFIFLVATLLMATQPAIAGGFFIPEQGTKAMGLGNAFTAIADDGSAMWFNPAGIAFQDGTVITLGTDLITPTNEFTFTGSTQTNKTKRETFVVPHAYLSYNSPELPVTLGLGINSPFGLSTDWTNSGAPFAAVAPALIPALGTATVSFSEIQMLNINPNVAFKVNDQLSIAVGAAYYDVTRVNLNNQVLTLNGKGSGWGGNAALLYKGDGINVGISYRTRVKADIDGSARYPLGSAPLLPVGFSTTAKTSITFPDLLSFGLAYNISDSLLASVNIDWVNWKTFDRINITQPALGAAGNLTIPENWKATTTFRIGMEWAYNSAMRARFGYVYDPTPINDVDFSPRLPGNDRQLFTLGYGYDISDSVTLDLGYAYVLLKDRTQTASAAPFYNGRYKSNVHIFAADVTARF